MAPPNARINNNNSSNSLNQHHHQRNITPHNYDNGISYGLPMMTMNTVGGHSRTNGNKNIINRSTLPPPFKATGRCIYSNNNGANNNTNIRMVTMRTVSGPGAPKMTVLPMSSIHSRQINDGSRAAQAVMMERPKKTIIIVIITTACCCRLRQAVLLLVPTLLWHRKPCKFCLFFFSAGNFVDSGCSPNKSKQGLLFLHRSTIFLWTHATADAAQYNRTGLSNPFLVCTTMNCYCREFESTLYVISNA